MERTTLTSTTPRRFGAGALALVLAVGLAAGGGTAALALRARGGAEHDHAHGGGPGAAPAEAAKVAEAKPLYVCPMHPSVTSDHPADCPICGMKLVKATPAAPNADARSEA